MNQSSADRAVFAHLVLHNSIASAGLATVRRCFDSLLSQQGFADENTLIVQVRDNASELREDLENLQREYSPRICFSFNQENLGFCAAHNQGVAAFLQSPASYLLILNPDLALEKEALGKLVEALEKHPQAGMATPRLYRADSELNPVLPLTIDAAGMYLTNSLRHLDRGSGKSDSREYDQNAFVFGGTGACLLLGRSCVEDLILESPPGFDAELYKIYPQLKPDAKARKQLFDEAFFAYREDADLAWRAQILGWSCIYVEAARGFHQRVVLPERRSQLPQELNLYGIRNRFLLQLNNFSFLLPLKVIFCGLIVRNVIVLFAVLLIERGSLPALKQIIALWSRAAARRKVLLARAGASPESIRKWFTCSVIPSS